MSTLFDFYVLRGNQWEHRYPTNGERSDERRAIEYANRLQATGERVRVVRTTIEEFYYTIPLKPEPSMSKTACTECSNGLTGGQCFPHIPGHPA